MLHTLSHASSPSPVGAHQGSPMTYTQQWGSIASEAMVVSRYLLRLYNLHPPPRPCRGWPQPSRVIPWRYPSPPCAWPPRTQPPPRRARVISSALGHLLRRGRYAVRSLRPSVSVPSLRARLGRIYSIRPGSYDTDGLYPSPHTPCSISTIDSSPAGSRQPPGLFAASCLAAHFAEGIKETMLKPAFASWTKTF